MPNKSYKDVTNKKISLYNQQLKEEKRLNGNKQPPPLDEAKSNTPIIQIKNRIIRFLIINYSSPASSFCVLVRGSAIASSFD